MPKVKKGRQFQLLPTQLPGGRNHMSGLPDDIGRIIGGRDRNIILAERPVPSPGDAQIEKTNILSNHNATFPHFLNDH